MPLFANILRLTLAGHLPVIAADFVKIDSISRFGSYNAYALLFL